MRSSAAVDPLSAATSSGHLNQSPRLSESSLVKPIFVVLNRASVGSEISVVPLVVPGGTGVDTADIRLERLARQGAGEDGCPARRGRPGAARRRGRGDAAGPRRRPSRGLPPVLYGRQSRFARDPSRLIGRGLGEVESVALGLMAKDMGLECWGMPNVEIVHANE
jgi:hypothetical protein